MGFPTPFPEPDSPELQRFAVRSPSEIVSRLRALQAAAVPLTAFVDAGASFGVVTLRGVDEIAGKLIFAGLADDGLRRQLLNSPLATFVGYDDAGKVQFAAAPMTHGAGDCGEVTSQMPANLFRLQRRSAARVRLDGTKAAVCRIPVPGAAAEWETLKVLDISIAGIALLTYPQRYEPIVGAEIDGCLLDLPGVGGASVSLKVSHASAHARPKLHGHCGCALLRIAPAVRKMLIRYMELRKASQ